MFVVLKQNWKTLVSYGYMQNKWKDKQNKKSHIVALGQNMQNKNNQVAWFNQNHARHKMDAENKLENESDKAPQGGIQNWVL